MWFGSVPTNKIGFAVNGLFNKLKWIFLIKFFQSTNINHVKYCQQSFSLDMPSDLWRK